MRSSLPSTVASTGPFASVSVPVHRSADSRRSSHVRSDGPLSPRRMVCTSRTVPSSSSVPTLSTRTGSVPRVRIDSSPSPLERPTKNAAGSNTGVGDASPSGGWLARQPGSTSRKNRTGERRRVGVMRVSTRWPGPGPRARRPSLASRRLPTPRWPSTCLISGGTVLDARTGDSRRADVLIRGRPHRPAGGAHRRRPRASAGGTRPGRRSPQGWMDMHVHFREPGQEHKETIADRRPRRRLGRVHGRRLHAQHRAAHRHARRGRVRPEAGRGAGRRRVPHRDGLEGPRGRGVWPRWPTWPRAAPSRSPTTAARSSTAA